MELVKFMSFSREGIGLMPLIEGMTYCMRIKGRNSFFCCSLLSSTIRRLTITNDHHILLWKLVLLDTVIRIVLHCR